MRQATLCSALLLAAASLYAEPFEIGAELSSPAFWGTSFEDFERAHREHGFSATGDGADGADSCLDGAVTCFGLPVYETRVLFADGKAVSRVELMLYAKAGTERYVIGRSMDGRIGKYNRRRIERPMSRAEFANVLETVRARLTPRGAKEPTKEANPVKDRDAKQKSQTWPRTALPSVATLTWNFSKPGGRSDAFAPGFVRLAVDGPAALAQAKPAHGGTKTAKAAHGAKSIAANVVRVRDASAGRGVAGDVFIDGVPMVDQGSKGYCAAATSERVLRYYGLEVDEHEIAQAAGTSAEGGTSGKAMRDSVAAVGRRHKLATVVAYGDLDKSTSERIRGLVKEAEAYNKTARKLKRKEIPREVYFSNHTYSANAFEEAMDPEVRMELKCRGPQKTKYKKFLADVRQQIDKGIPLFWGVTLGMFPEEDVPQSKGGHMRLIIGYNERTGEIIYSDSWGKGHEFKRMPADRAFTIAHSLMYLRPLR